jgi:hypothetical protein
MVEIISDMTMIWVSIFMTMLFLTAFAKVNVFFIEWELRTNWKRQLVDMESYDDEPPFLVHFCSKLYRPKIPSLIDHTNQDDEDSTLVVFYCRKTMRRNFCEKIRNCIIINEFSFSFDIMWSS